MRLVGLVLLTLTISLPAGAEVPDPGKPEPPAELDGAELAEYLRTHGCAGCRIADRNLAGQDLDRANLAGAEIDRVDLRGATCGACNLDRAHMGVVQLDGASFTGASLRKATFACSTDFPDMMCTDYASESSTVDFTRADLRGADLSGLPDVLLKSASVEGARFPAAFAPSLNEALFDTVWLIPGYASISASQAFSRSEIARLTPYLERCTVCWTVYTYVFASAGGKTPHPPSFDCAHASSATERAICASDQLCALDCIVAAAFERAKETGGADVSELKRGQRAWLVRRDGCGEHAECIHEALRPRAAELLVGDIPPSFSAGTYRTFSHAPLLPEGIDGTRTGTKLGGLLSNNADRLKVSVKTKDTVHVEGEALSASGDVCEVDDEYRFDPLTGRYFATSGDSAKQAGALVLIDSFLLFEGGVGLCGSNASLAGVWVRVGP